MRQAAPSATRPEPHPAGTNEHPNLTRLPTEAEIAAEVRRRPVGAVIADICRDLGIAPTQFDQPSWDELCLAIITYGGKLSDLLQKLHQRLSAFATADLPPQADPPPRSPALATGPP